MKDYQLTNLIRNNEIFKAYLIAENKRGIFAKLALKYGITRERIRQIVEKKKKVLDKI